MYFILYDVCIINVLDNKVYRIRLRRIVMYRIVLFVLIIFVTLNDLSN